MRPIDSPLRHGDCTLSHGGELALGNHGLTGLARSYGTPLHVINEKRLMKNAVAFQEAVGEVVPRPRLCVLRDEMQLGSCGR